MGKKTYLCILAAMLLVVAVAGGLRFYNINRLPPGLHYDEAFNNLHMGRACCYAFILFMIIFAITMAQIKLSKRMVHTEVE